MKNFQSCFFVFSLLTFLLFASATADNNVALGSVEHTRAERFVGGVYAMSNNVTDNTIISYGRLRDGTLKLINATQKTGGRGAVLNTGNPFDPLFSAFSVILSSNQRFVLAVNAGSNSVSVFEVLPDFSLSLVSVQPVPGSGPVSIASSGSFVYVASIDADGDFDDIFTQKGLLSGFRLSRSGRLSPIEESQRQLTFRPAAIKFSPDRRSLIVSDLFSGANALRTGSVKEISVFRVSRKGLLSDEPVTAVTSTELNNSEGRNLPGAIGFEVVRVGKVQYVVVPEVRSLAGADGGSPPDQASSVSTWRLSSRGQLSPVQLDLLVGPSLTAGQRDSCWIEFSKNLRSFWVANTPSNSISAFSFRGGRARLVSEVAANPTEPVDLWRSRDGKFVYQLLSGTVAAFRVARGGRRPGLTQIQTVMDVPVVNPQGIVAL